MKIAVIGAGGKMGRWACRFGINENLDIIASDKDTVKLDALPAHPRLQKIPDVKEAVSKAKIIIISVPLADIEEAVKEIAPYIKSGSFVMDISSVKAGPVSIMKKHIKTSIVLGTHPLFGPNVADLSGQNIVFTPTSEKEKALAKEVAAYFENRNAHVTFMEPEAHDKMMSVVQGLSHFVAIASAEALSGLGELKQLKDISTTTFRIFVNYIESVIGDDPELYAAIQMAHPEMPHIYRSLSQSIETFADMVKEKDTKSFVKKMKLLKKYLGK